MALNEQKAYEDAIRKDEREEIRRTAEATVAGLVVAAKKLLKATGSSMEIYVGEQDPKTLKARPQRERAATVASTAEIALVHEWLTTEFSTPKQMKKCGLGSRTIAAACRELVNQKRAETDSRGGYRIVAQPNGPEVTTAAEHD